MHAAFNALPKPAEFKLSTGPILRVLERLGNPQHRLPPVIHIAGTNGKGSTTAFMRAICEAHGLKVHVDISPHLIRVNERIRVAGELISDDFLRECADRILKANAGEPLSFFEGMTAASLIAFSETPADICLVEVGLGGRFDSTNVFNAPHASVITPIAHDHKDLLGKHLCQVAWEKAGIIKKGCPAISAQQDSEVARTLRAEARYCSAPLTFLPDALNLERHDDGTVTYTVGEKHFSNLRPGLAGPHQAQNAALATLALKTAGVFELDPDKTREGIANVTWPARMQILAPGPLTGLSGGKKIYLDGGHNPHAAKAVMQTLKDDAPVPVIMGMLSNKDADAFISAIAPIAETFTAVPLSSSHKFHEPEVLARIASRHGLTARTARNVEEAIRLNKASQYKTLLICGSLYLAGDVLHDNGEELR